MQNSIVFRYDRQVYVPRPSVFETIREIYLVTSTLNNPMDLDKIKKLLSIIALILGFFLYLKKKDGLNIYKIWKKDFFPNSARNTITILSKHN
jgi:hypothetical protein